jgi:hypothetical protein
LRVWQWIGARTTELEGLADCFAEPARFRIASKASSVTSRGPSQWTTQAFACDACSSQSATSRLFCRACEILNSFKSLMALLNGLRRRLHVVFVRPNWQLCLNSLPGFCAAQGHVNPAQSPWMVQAALQLRNLWPDYRIVAPKHKLGIQRVHRRSFDVHNATIEPALCVLSTIIRSD